MISRTEMSSFQLTFFLIHAQIGVGVISLPYDIFLKAKTDAWISVLLTGMIVQIIIFLYGILIRRFPELTLYDICVFLFGKIFGKMLILLLVISYISAATIIIAKFAYLLKIWMMPMTPRWILIAILCLTAIFIMKENIQVIARFIVLMSVVFIGFIVACFYAFVYADITFILPVGSSGPSAITKGILPSIFSFQGFEILLIIHPFVKATPKSIVKSASISNIFITLFYTMLVTATLLFFSADELKIVPEPVLYLMKAFSSRVIERPDLLFTSMWIVLVTTTLIITIYTISLGALTAMNSTNIRNYVILLTLICFILSLSFTGAYQLNFVSKLHNYIISPILYGIPILLLLTSLILRKSKEVHHK